MRSATDTIGATIEEHSCGGIIYFRYRSPLIRFWKLYYEKYCANCGEVLWRKEYK